MAVNAFDPIDAFDGSCVNTVAALFADGFATTAIGDPYVVTNGATHSATRDRELSLHFLMIRLCGGLACSIWDPRPQNMIARSSPGEPPE